MICVVHTLEGRVPMSITAAHTHTHVYALEGRPKPCSSATSPLSHHYPTKEGATCTT